VTRQAAYPTEADAIARVEALKQLGIWPGMIRLPSGWVVLTHDVPDVRLSRSAWGEA
jgi:uncharacterized protein YbdZ (MbtH family)